jgi:hypothetical protein
MLPLCGEQAALHVDVFLWQNGMGCISGSVRHIPDSPCYHACY